MKYRDESTQEELIKEYVKWNLAGFTKLAEPCYLQLKKANKVKADKLYQKELLKTKEEK